jgi:pilus assembly protein CpaC
MNLPKTPGRGKRLPALLVLGLGGLLAMSSNVLAQDPVQLGMPLETKEAVPQDLPRVVEAPIAGMPISSDPGGVPASQGTVIKIDPRCALPSFPTVTPPKLDSVNTPSSAGTAIKIETGIAPTIGMPVKVDSGGYLPAPIVANPTEDSIQLPRSVEMPLYVAEKRSNNYLEQFVVPEEGIDLTLGIPRMVILREKLERIQIGGGDDRNSPATFEVTNQRELSLLGRKVGRTILNMWFADPSAPGKQRIVSYDIRVLPDMQQYHELEKQVNDTFPRSRVGLKIVGNNLLVMGQAASAAESVQIMRILETGLDWPTHYQHDRESLAHASVIQERDYANSLSLNMVDLLHVQSERQVMLRIAVTEVDRSVVPNLSIGSGSLPARLNSKQLDHAIESLISMNLARTVYETTVVVRNGQAGSVQNGPAFTGSPFRPGSMEFQPLTIGMTVVPVISERDEITLNIDGELIVRDAVYRDGTSTHSTPGMNKRAIQAILDLRQGQTMALAGVKQNVYSAGKSYSRFPVVGARVGTVPAMESERELIITITPELVRQHTAGQSQTDRVISSQR